MQSEELEGKSSGIEWGVIEHRQLESGGKDLLSFYLDLLSYGFSWAFISGFTDAPPIAAADWQTSRQPVLCRCSHCIRDKSLLTLTFSGCPYSNIMEQMSPSYCGHHGSQFRKLLSIVTHEFPQRCLSNRRYPSRECRNTIVKFMFIVLTSVSEKLWQVSRS